MNAGKKSGFTLLELGMVLIILSLMAGGVLAVANQNIRVAKQTELKAKLDRIEAAILSFRREKGYIPCPGWSGEPIRSSNFGFQAIDPGSCMEGDNVAAPAASYDDYGGGGNTVAGMIPVRTLGLPDEYVYDPWGGRFLYVVDRRATISTTFTPAKLNDTSAIGSITVLDDTGGTRTSIAVLLILSHGPNGHGAHMSSGSQKFVGSANLHEQMNCHCDASTNTAFTSTFYIHPTKISTSGVLDEFDDVLRYYTRQQLTSPATDTVTETP